MGVSLEGKLVVAISSRALFDFEEENQVFETGDDRAYMKLQLERLDKPAAPGVARVGVVPAGGQGAGMPHERGHTLAAVGCLRACSEAVAGGVERWMAITARERGARRHADEVPHAVVGGLVALVIELAHPGGEKCGARHLAA